MKAQGQRAFRAVKRRVSKFSPRRMTERRRVLNAQKAERLPQSAIFYTTHKCASVFVDRLLTTITNSSPYVVRNYASTIQGLGDRVSVDSPYEPFLEKNSDLLYFRKGEIYGPQRRPLDFPDRSTFKHIFFLRDPRDVLVSNYYSLGYTHSLPKSKQIRNNFVERRAYIQKVGIDRYCIEDATDWILPLYTEYRRLFESATSRLYLKYDQFKDETVQFVEDICSFLGVEVKRRRIEALAASASPVRQGAPQMSHKRSGKTGQWHEELRPETIAQLNETLSPILAYWDFKDA